MGPNSKVTFLKVITTKSPTYVIKKKKKGHQPTKPGGPKDI